jgi:DNA-binding NarL/FixJ family response regulator
MDVRPCALIVEDEVSLALELEDAMSAMGFYVCGVASTGSRARSLAMSDNPDIVLMDVCLEGGREGIEAARWVREVCQSEVVFVTAYTDEDTLQRIQQQVPGAAVLPKPVSHNHLAKAVAAFASKG